MKYLSLLFVCICCLPFLTAVEEHPPVTETEKDQSRQEAAGTDQEAAAADKDAEADMTLEQEGAYLLGLKLGMDATNGIQQLGGGLDTDLMIEGFTDVLKQQEFKVDPRERFDAVIQQLRQQAEEKKAEAAAANASRSKKFLEDLRGKEGIAFTDSGIGYEVLKAGEGDKPTGADNVKVHYRGTLMSGKEFDSSYRRGEPFTTQVDGRVIQGWQEALKLMSPGAKYRFYIPSELAYGPMGSRSIGPNEALIFEIELLEIVK